MNALKPLTALGIAAALVAGCATGGDGQRTRMEGTAAGALIGGLVGALIDGERGAAIGATLGAGAGYLVGNEIARRKALYASTEDYLNGEAARVAEFNATTRQYNARLEREISTLGVESERLRARHTAGSAQRAQLDAQRATVRAEIDRANQLERNLARELEVQSTILADERRNKPANDPYIVRLEREIGELQRNLETLRTSSSQLAMIDQRLSV
jgi:uncharacterized protein YcfJ